MAGVRAPIYARLDLCCDQSHTGPYVNFMHFIIIFKCLLGLGTLYFVSLSLFRTFIRFRVMRVIYVIFLIGLGFVAINICL
jgi:hypothetical protein